MATDVTEPSPTADGRKLSTWTTDHLNTRFDSLTKITSRKRLWVDRAEARVVFDQQIEALEEHRAALQAAVDGKERLGRDRYRLMTENRILRERVDELEGKDQQGLAVRGTVEVNGATRYGEHTIDLGKAEAHRIVLAARIEARQMLETAQRAVADGPPKLTLPPEPKWSGDRLADAEPQARYLVEREEALEAHGRACADYQAAIDAARAEVEAEKEEIGKRRDGIVATLDELEAKVPEVRQRVIDLTERSGEPTQAIEQVAS